MTSPATLVLKFVVPLLCYANPGDLAPTCNAALEKVSDTVWIAIDAPGTVTWDGTTLTVEAP